MAVEIKELVIRAVVDYPSSEESSSGTQNDALIPSEQDQSKIVQACVNQVLKILKQKEKR